MPGVFTHIGFAENLVGHGPFKDSAIKSHSNYYNWGAVGPDFLFFHPSELPVIKDVYDDLEKIYVTFRDVIKIYNNLSEILNKVQDGAGVVANHLTGGLWNQMGQTGQAIGSAVSSHIAKFVLTTVDPFEEFLTPKIYNDPRQAAMHDWNWIELGHYHRTGDVLSELWNTSGVDPQKKAYCLGYSTHIAADAIGHPFVNLFTGGPYRNHWRRHVLVEKVFDTHFWSELYKGESISNSHAYKKMIIGSEEHFNLPEEIQNWIASAYTKIYEPIKGEKIGGSQIDFMFKNFYEYGIKSPSEWSLLNFPKPESFDFFELSKALGKKLVKKINSPPKFPHLKGGIKLSNIKAFIKFLVEGIVWAVECLVTLLAIPVQMLLETATALPRYILYLIVKLCYKIYEDARIALAYGAYSHPEPSWNLKHFSSILKPSKDDQSIMYEVYPYKNFTKNEPMLQCVSEQTYHLFHPLISKAEKETPSTKAFPPHPAGFSAGLPDFLFSSKASGSVAEEFYNCGVNPEPDFVEHLTKLPNCSAAELAIQIANRGLGNVPNWNLDGDRGYAYPVWKTDNSPPWDPKDIVY